MANDLFQGVDPQLPDGSIIELMDLQWMIIDPHEHDSNIFKAVTYVNNVETRTLVKTDCGHYCPIDPTRRMYSRHQGLYIGVSDTEKHYCHLHAARCDRCHKTLCTQGNTDAFKTILDGQRRPIYFCWDCKVDNGWTDIRSELWNAVNDFLFGR